MKMENHSLQIAIIFAIILAATTTTMMVVPIGIAHASIWGDLGIGYQDGKNQAYNDFSNHVYGDACPRDGIGTASYCAGYTLGYDVEMGAESQVQP
jgi:hypothetical protein